MVMKKGLLLTLLLGSASLLFASDAPNAPIDMTHRMMGLAMQVGVILFAARMGNLLFTKLRLPSVLGELIAGVAIGPFALGRLWDGWIFQSFTGSPVAVSPELYGLCTVASIVLLFLVGAETDLRMFMRYSAVGSLVGIGGVVVSYVTGAAVGVYVMGLEWTNPTAILMGVMSTATSVSITARILSERRKLDSQEGVTILAGAVIDDVLGIIMLAIGMGMIAAQQSGESVSWAHISGIAARSFGVWLGATAFGVIASQYISRLLKPCGSHGEVAVLTLGLALLVGGLFEKAHLAMIIGAYVTGLSFSRTDMGIMIQEKLHGLYQFLVPIFFVVMGMMVDVAEFMDPTVLAAGLIYTVVAILAKIIGCGLPTLLFGFTPMGALRVGLGMVPRGEVALIIAGIAAAAGHSEVLGVAVLMTLLTTLAAPPLLVTAFNIRKRGHRQEEDNTAVPTAVYNFPNHAVTNNMMARIIHTLSNEDFFTHQIDPAEGLYQARRSDMVLTIVCGDNTISFSAKPEALPFVRVVMKETIAEFEGVLEALKKPISEDTHLAIDDASATNRKKLSPARLAVLNRHIKERTIIHRLTSTTRDGIIHELLLRLREVGAVQDLERAEEEILKRERVMPTCVGSGVACPHTRTNTVSKLVCAIGITNEPMDFSDEEEGHNCRIVILTLTPDAPGSPYMTFITAILTALRSEETREAILNAPTAAAIKKAFLAP